MFQKLTIQVYLPNGGFNVVKFGDATDIKVIVFSSLDGLFVCKDSNRE